MNQRGRAVRSSENGVGSRIPLTTPSLMISTAYTRLSELQAEILGAFFTGS